MVGVGMLGVMVMEIKSGHKNSRNFFLNIEHADSDLGLFLWSNEDHRRDGKAPANAEEQYVTWTQVMFNES